MKRSLFIVSLLTLCFTSVLCLAHHNEAFAIGEDDKGLKLLTTKYPPHKYEIHVKERYQEISNENLNKNIFEGPGLATTGYTGSISGTTQIGGAVNFGSVIFPGTISATTVFNKTRSIAVNTTYTVKMLKQGIYVLSVHPMYEYCKFSIVDKATKRVVENGSAERPIGVKCEQKFYTHEEWEQEKFHHEGEAIEADKSVSASVEHVANVQEAGEKSPLISEKKSRRCCSLWAVLCAASE